MEMDQDVPNYGIPIIISSTLMFAACNVLLLRRITPQSAQKTKSQFWKWRNIANSLIHSFITGIWACVCFYLDKKMGEDLINVWSVTAHSLVAVSIGYFIYDFFDMAWNNRKRSSYELMIHHTLVISCFGLAVMERRYIGYSVVALLVEVNSIFLHTRQLMLIQGFSKDEFIYRLNSLMNIGTFLVFRILTLGWMTRWLVIHRDEIPTLAYTVGSIGLSVITLMSIILFFRILSSDFGRRRKKTVVPSCGSIEDEKKTKVL
ncbi:TLC domain-containing protein 2-like [Artemia franciscana]|uniref:TLC domain-containing protein 2-like n=1 Tax=Artemia franciscana TaxID=6661 RepID=UPI0032DA6578